MWFDYKKEVAPLYKYETDRRLFATSPGRRSERQRGNEAEGEGEDTRTRWLAERWRERWARWTGQVQ